MIVGQILVGLTAAQCRMAAPITAGLTGARLEIRYANPAWKDLGRLVTFQGGKVSRSLWETDGTVTIPWEVLQKSGTNLTVGITGTDAAQQVRIPTVPIALCRIQPGTVPGEAESDPTLPIWAQLDDRIRTVESQAVDRDILDASVTQALEEARRRGDFTGPKGDPARVEGFAAAYQAGTSGSLVPQGAWSDTVPNVPQGQYLWTRTTTRFNSGDPVVSYSVTRMGLDGRGSVASVADISPDERGNVPLTAAHLHALPDTGGDLTGQLRMNGNPIAGLPEPKAPDQAANMGYVNQKLQKAAPRNLLDNSDFRNPVNQRGQTSYASDGYCFDRWVIWHSNGCNVSYDSEKQCVRISSTAETTLYQRLPKGILNQNKKYTQAYGLTGGRVVISTRIDYSPERYDSVEGIMLSTGQTMEIVWTALYEGEYTPETLPEYRPKGYGAELAECQRYYKRIHDAKFVISPNLQTIYRGSSIYFGDMASPDNLTVNMIPDGDGNIGLVQKVSFIPFGTTDLRLDGAVSNTISIATTNEDWAGRQVVLYCIELSAEIL